MRMAFNSFTIRAVVAGARSILVLSALVATSAEAATINPLSSSLSRDGNRQPSYDFTQDEVSLGATANSRLTQNNLFALVPQRDRKLDLDWGTLDSFQVEDALNQESLQLASSETEQLSENLSRLDDVSASAIPSIKSEALLGSNLALYDFQALTANRNIETFHYADGTDVPEPLTVIATLIGGSAVVGMRKKLAKQQFQIQNGVRVITAVPNSNLRT